MKAALTLIAGLVLSQSALADGFICESQEQSLRIKAFHQTQPELGTRNAAVLIVSDPSINAGRKTIATFHADNTLLSNSGAHYDASVDLRFKASRRKGELIGPTKLGELQNIKLDVAFTYVAPVADGQEMPGMVTLVKRSGDEIELDVTCTRYLKGE
jgi:hypothetical protein